MAPRRVGGGKKGAFVGSSPPKGCELRGPFSPSGGSGPAWGRGAGGGLQPSGGARKPLPSRLVPGVRASEGPWGFFAQLRRDAFSPPHARLVHPS